MEVKLLQHTNLINSVVAIRTCWDSFDRMDSKMENDKECIGEKDIELLDRVVNKHSHESTIEHIVFTFDIKGISRACLQELARHRMASYSVQSSRYTLKKLVRDVEEFKVDDLDTLSQFFYIKPIEDNPELISSLVVQANELLKHAKSNLANDVIKYLLPEAYKTNLIFTINLRSLRNFINLRSTRRALPEIRALALEIYKAIPEEYKMLLENHIHFDE